MMKKGLKTVNNSIQLNTNLERQMCSKSNFIKNMTIAVGYFLIHETQIAFFAFVWM